MREDPDVPFGSVVYHNAGGGSEEQVDRAEGANVNNFMSLGGVMDKSNFDKDMAEYGLATQTTIKTATINFDSNFKPYAGTDSNNF